MANLPSTGAAIGRGDLSEVLSRLFNRTGGSQERLRAVEGFCRAVMATLGDRKDLVGRAAEVLTRLVSQLPVRSHESLRANYGPDEAAVATTVINDAATLAGRLWIAAAAIPGPPSVAHAIKVVGHSVVEIRMVGELHGLYGDPGWSRDPLWLTAVLATWATDHPVAVGPATVTGARDIAAKVGQAFGDLRSTEGRLANVTRAGRQGSDAVRRSGQRMQRRMLTHPRMWSAPDTTPLGTALGQAVAAAVAERVPGSGREEASSSPHAHLADAWRHHRLARDATDAAGPAEPAVLDRLQMALAAQANELRYLTGVLGGRGPAMSVAHPSGPAGLAGAGEHARRAEDAMARAEDRAARSRHLASWSPARRNALVYTLVALLLSTPVAVATTFGFVDPPALLVALLLAQCLVLPWVTLAIGGLAVGRVFRTHLGGRARRTPVAGALVAIATHTVVALVLGVLTFR